MGRLRDESWIFENRIGVEFRASRPGIRAKHEDTLALRLTSKLADLRAGYVNRILQRLRRAERSSNRIAPQRKEKRHPNGIPFSLSRVDKKDAIINHIHRQYYFLHTKFFQVQILP